MAVAQTFSPKEWKAAVVSDATNAGATGKIKRTTTSS